MGRLGRTHLARGDKRFGAFAVPTSEARRDQVGDAGRFLHKRLGLGAREKLERKLRGEKSASAFSKAQTSEALERKLAFFISRRPMRMTAA